MRKIIILAMCLVLLLTISVLPVMAASSVNASLSADSTSVSIGSNVTVTVYAEVDSCGDGGIKVSFDNSAFSLVSGSCLVSNAFMSTFQTSTGHGAFAFQNSSPVSGAVFQFTLSVKESAPSGSHAVTVIFNADGTSVTRSITITLACDHTYDNGCDETCNRCGATRTAGHKYDSGKVTTAATCTKEGVKPYTCSVCGKTKTETISKAAHQWDDGKKTKTPTCSTPGEMLYTCDACPATKTEEIDTLPHDYEVIDYFPATCTENGGMSFKCRDCGYTYDDYIEAEGHIYTDDCDETCETCGEEREVEHFYAGEDEEPKWFSDKDGHWQECKHCKKPQEPIPHTPGPAATETSDQVCLDCGFVITPAIAHTHKGTGNFLGDDHKHWFLCACGELMGEGDHIWEDKGIENGQQIHKCVICSRVKAEPVESTPPTEAPTVSTTAPTQAPAQTTAPVSKPVDQVGILVQWWWVIPVGIAALAILGVGIYVAVGLILAFRKPGKYDTKHKNDA